MDHLAAQLRRLDRAGLARLIDARPDAVARPEPRSLTELAQRLSIDHSVVLALQLLDRAGLQAAEALAALGGVANRAELAGFLDPAGPFEAALLELTELALVTEDRAGVLRLAAPLRIWAQPLGLGVRLADVLPVLSHGQLGTILDQLGVRSPGRKSELIARVTVVLKDADRVRRLVDRGPNGAREILLKTAWEGPYLVGEVPYFGYQNGPVTWAVQRGLLARVGYDDVQMPAEIALALRGPDYREPFTAAPPEPATGVVAEAELTAAGAAAATQALADVEGLLELCDRTPLGTTKAGRVAVRELRRAVKVTGLDVESVAMLLSTAIAAGLIDLDGGSLVLTERADAWRNAEPAARLASVLAGWWSVDTDLDRLATRHRVVGYLAELPAGTRVDDATALASYLVWRHPLELLGGDGAGLIPASLADAERFGVVALGAATPLARALTAGGAEALAAASAGLAPAPVPTAAFLSDLSVVVSGVPAAGLASLLDSAATRETAGAAYTWRFSTASVRAGLDAGVDAEGLLAALTEVATGELPQALRYLVRDVARRHGHMRVAPAASVICSEDQSLLAELAAHRGLAGLGLRAVAPTVLVSAAVPGETLGALRDAGYAPIGQTASGVTRVERRELRRSAAEEPAAGWIPTAVDAEAVADRLLSATGEGGVPVGSDVPAELATVVARRADNLSAAEHRVLIDAIVTGQPIRIDYVSGAGQITSRVIEKAEMTGDAVVAWCRLRDAERMFVLARILSVSPAG